MNMRDAVAQGGPGASLLFLYIYASLYLWIPSINQGPRIFIAASAAFVFSVSLELGSDAAIAFISFPIILRTKREIDEVSDGGEFYWSDEDQQDKLDKFDNQVFRYTVLIYAGAIICLSLPIQGYFYGVNGLTVAVSSSLIVFLLFIYLPFLKVRNIIETSAKLYG